MTGILSLSDNEIPQVITNKCVFNKSTLENGNLSTKE